MAFDPRQDIIKDICDSVTWVQIPVMSLNRFGNLDIIFQALDYMILSGGRDHIYPVELLH